MGELILVKIHILQCHVIMVFQSSKVSELLPSNMCFCRFVPSNVELLIDVQEWNPFTINYNNDDNLYITQESRAGDSMATSVVE